MQYVRTPCVWLAWCGGCLCGPGLVKLRAVMDVNRLASSYCVNINHQAWMPPPHVALLNIHNTLHTSQPQTPAHTYTLTCACSQSFCLTSAPFLPLFFLSLDSVSTQFSLSPFFFLFLSQSFIVDFSLALPCLPLYITLVCAPFLLTVNRSC